MNETSTQCSNEYIPHPNDPVSDEYMELKNEPVLYDWEIEVPMYGAWFVSMFGGGVGLLIAGCFALFGEENSFVGSILFSLLGVFSILFIRYFGHPNEIFHYFITPKGVYYTQRGKVSDNFYLVINMLGWLLVLVSLAAVAVIGPFALAGAGGGAFMAMGMTKMRAKVRFHGRYFHNGKVDFGVYKKDSIIDIESCPFSLKYCMTLYCNDNNFSEVCAIVKSFLPDRNEFEIASRRDVEY